MFNDSESSSDYSYEESLVSVPQVVRRVHKSKETSKTIYNVRTKEVHVPEIRYRDVNVRKTEMRLSTRYVDSPQVQYNDYVVDVPQTQYVDRYVPRVYIQEVEKVVVVPQYQYVEKFVEVPQIEERVSYRPKIIYKYADEL